MGTPTTMDGIFNESYYTYEIVAENVYGMMSGEIYFYFRTAAGDQVTSYAYGTQKGTWTGSTPMYSGSTSGSQGYTAQYCSSSSSSAGFFSLLIHNPYDSTKYTTWVCNGQSGDTMSGSPIAIGTGVYSSMNQVTGIKMFPMSSTNGFDTTTKFTIYGYRK